MSLHIRPSSFVAVLLAVGSSRLWRGHFRLVALAGMFAFVIVILAVRPAAAHVGIVPRDVRPSAFQVFTVRVPTERAEPTVAVRVEFPAGFTVSRFQPRPGWQRTVDRDPSGRIIAVTWSGGSIGEGEYEDFGFQARTPADAGKLAFPAFQTYLTGETVPWTGAEGSERPAPVVEVRAAAAGAATDEHGATRPAEAPAGAASAPGASGAGGTGGTNVAAPAPSLLSDDPAPEASDLPLFIALGAVGLALLAAAMSGIALARQSGGR
ncbi:MAG TPA: YcnI family protein [Chloroflexota bacterium]|nr:YcnI family protein [Chloroflexota bacterium]